MKQQKKFKRVFFYHLEARKEKTIKVVDQKMSDTYKLFKKHKSSEIATEEIAGENYYIYSMDKSYPDNNDNTKFAYEFSISKLSLNKPIAYGDMGEENLPDRNKNLDFEKLNLGENERPKGPIGPIVNSTFIYDPNTHIIAFFRTPGGVTTILLKRFLSHYCGVRGLVLAVVPDKDVLSDIDKLNNTSKLTYKIADVSNFESLEKDDQDELVDIKDAHNLGAGGLEITISGSSLKLEKLKDRVKLLFKHGDELNVKKLEIEGTNDDGVLEPIDLIDHKLTFDGYIVYDNIITDKNCFALLDNALASNYDFLRKFKRKS